MTDYSDVGLRDIPWNRAEKVSTGWYRRTWQVDFDGPPDLTDFTPSPARPDDDSARAPVLTVVIPESPTNLRVDVYLARQDDADPRALNVLEVETIWFDSLLLQRLAGCGRRPPKINGLDRHPVLGMAVDHDHP